MLLALEVNDMLEKIFSKLFALMHSIIASLFLFNFLELNYSVSQDIIQKHLSQIICIVVHHAATHFRYHSNTTRILAEHPILVASLISCFGQLYVSLRLFDTLKHRLQFLREVSDLRLKIRDMGIWVVSKSAKYLMRNIMLLLNGISESLLFKLEL